MYYAIVLSKANQIHSLAPASSKSISTRLVSVWMLYSRPLLCFVNTLVVLQNFSYRWHLEILKEVEIAGARPGLCGGWEGQSVRVFWFLLCFETCDRALSWCRLMAITFWVRPVLKRCCKVLRVWMYRCMLVLPLVKKFPTFCATEGPLPRSQKPATWNLYSEPDESSPRPPFYFFKAYFNIIPPFASRYSRWLLSFSFSHHDPVCIFVLPYRCRVTHLWGAGDSTNTLCILGFHTFHKSVHANSRSPEAPPHTHKIIPATTLPTQNSIWISSPYSQTVPGSPSTCTWNSCLVVRGNILFVIVVRVKSALLKASAGKLTLQDLEVFWLSALSRARNKVTTAAVMRQCSVCL